MQKIKKHFYANALACIILLTAAVSAMALPLSAQQLQKMVKQLDLPAGSLSSALKKLEASASLRFAYDEEALRQVAVPATSYRSRTVASILSDLLGKSNLRYEERYNTILIYDSAKAPTITTGTQQAEKIVLTGVVTEKNGPVPGANVIVKGTTHGAITNAEGRFRITTDAAPNIVLLVSMIGYGTQEIAAGSRRDFNIMLETSALNLNQLVVIGYGAQSKAKISGAVSEVLLDKLNSRSLNDMAEALQGKAPGVIVQNQGGDPTSTPKVYIRGMGGINGENPLYIVDGSIYSGGPINPNDVESITVLKDASTSIYGARASGGVVLVTTKKGKAGKPVIDLDAKTGWQSAIKKLEPLGAKDFADVMNKGYDAAGKPRQEAFDATAYPDGQITRTNWMDEIFRTGRIQDYNAGIRGGSDQGRYYMGFGYRKGEGILLNTYSERYSFRINTDYQLKPWLKIGENLSLTYTNGNGANTTSAYTGAIISAIFYPPHIRPYTSTGAFSGLPEKYSGAYGDVINPVAYLQRIDARAPETKININPYAELRIANGLTFRSNLAITKSFRDAKTFSPKVTEIGKIFNFNELRENINNFTELLTEQTLTYTRKFGQHNLTGVAGYSFQKHDGTYLTVYSQGYNDERKEYRYFDNGTSIFKPTSGRNRWSMTSLFGRINYDFNNRYLLGLIGRYDGTSLLPSHNRYQPYYGITAGWLASEENFMKNVSLLSFLKLRGSYGIQGNLSSLPPNVVDVPLASSEIFIGQNPAQVPGYMESSIPNPDITWANSVQSNVGIDAGFLQNRLNLTADYFVKKTRDMLLKVAVPSTAGVPDGMWKNAGEATDKGFELGLNFRADQTGDFQYDLGVTLTKVTNTLNSLEEGKNSIPTDGINIRSTLTPIRIETGQPLYSYYVVKTAGIFKSQEEVNNHKSKDGTLIQEHAKPGDLRFVDQNGDGKITNADRVFVGSAYPDFTYGFSFNGSYKGFDLNLFFQGVQGNKLFNALKFTALNASNGQNYNMLKDILNAWSPENPNSNIPRINGSDPNGNFGTTSDWYIEDGSYLRLKNVTLGYTLPAHLVKRAGIGPVRIYVTGSNLLTFTKYKGFDPEVGMDEFGIDKGRYPQSKNIILGLNINL